nr:ribonuclease H-like domain-containing protein [Tanacetum cinerariifolium]GEZ18291.1 ribonuclease H-like domain-containing protein [Tanacetum cinerariifolium]
MSANDKFGLGYGDYRYGSILSYENEVLQSVFMNKECDLENTPLNDRYAKGMHTVPPPMTGNYMPSGPDVEINYSKFTYGRKQTSADESDSKPVEYTSSDSDSSVEPYTSVLEPIVNESKVVSKPKAVCEPKVWTDAPIIEEYESDSDDDLVFNVQKNIKKPSFAFTDSVKHVKSPRENVKETGIPNHYPKIEKQDKHSHTRKGILLLRPQKDDPHKALKDKGIVDSGCSRHMTGNKAHLADYQEFKGGTITVGGSNERITSKGKIKVARLDFEDVYYVEELKHYNLIFVSQMCDKKNKVLFTDTDCLVMSSDFKLPDENQDETTPILKDLIRQAEDQFNHKVKTIRSDNGTEFKNPDLIEFYGLKGIKREYSNAKTPQ